MDFWNRGLAYVAPGALWQHHHPKLCRASAAAERGTTPKHKDVGPCAGACRRTWGIVSAGSGPAAAPWDNLGAHFGNTPSGPKADHTVQSTSPYLLTARTNCVR